MPVVIALELDDLVAMRVAASQTDGTHRGLGAAGNHAHLLSRRHQLADLLGQGDLALAWSAVRHAAIELSAHGVIDEIRPMTEDHRAPRANEVDVLVAVDVPNMAALGMVVEHRSLVHVRECANRRVHTTGNARVRLFETGVGSFVVRHLVGHSSSLRRFATPLAKS